MSGNTPRRDFLANLLAMVEANPGWRSRNDWCALCTDLDRREYFRDGLAVLRKAGRIAGCMGNGGRGRAEPMLFAAHPAPPIPEGFEPWQSESYPTRPRKIRKTKTTTRHCCRCRAPFKAVDFIFSCPCCRKWQIEQGSAFA